MSSSSWLSFHVPPPEERLPLTVGSFVREILPSYLTYFVMAYLALLPNTLKIRQAFLPVIFWCLFRAATQVDVIGENKRFAYMGQGHLLGLTLVGMKSIIWATTPKPLRRRDQIKKSDSSSPTPSTKPRSTLQLLNDAFWLLTDFRGLEWTWSGVHPQRVPAEPRDINNRYAFLRSTALMLLKDLVFFDFIHYAAQSFDPKVLGGPTGGSIFDASLPPLARYARSSALVVLTGFEVYSIIHCGFLFFTLIGVGLFRQSPKQWPLTFDSPWRGTSLHDFWGKRWHQLFRDIFWTLGSLPLGHLVGPFGTVMGAFVISAILHEFGAWGAGGDEPWGTPGAFFLIMGLGMRMEDWWRSATGRMVHGNWGRLWVVVWNIGWGHLSTNTWAKRGLLGSQYFPEVMRPSVWIFGSH